MKVLPSTTHRGIGIQRFQSPNHFLAHQVHQDRRAQQKRPVRRLSLKDTISWFDRHSQKQSLLQVFYCALLRSCSTGVFVHHRTMYNCDQFCDLFAVGGLHCNVSIACLSFRELMKRLCLAIKQ
jgi:hypothetical protein